MTPSLEIAVDRERRLLTFTAAGFFDLESAAAIGPLTLAALHELGGAPTNHVSLVDVSRFKIQARDVVEVFAAVIRNKRYMARRIAFVVDQSSLSKMQIRRMLQGVDRARIFEDRAAALAWLGEPAIQDRAA